MTKCVSPASSYGGGGALHATDYPVTPVFSVTPEQDRTGCRVPRHIRQLPTLPLSKPPHIEVRDRAMWNQHPLTDRTSPMTLAKKNPGQQAVLVQWTSHGRAELQSALSKHESILLHGSHQCPVQSPQNSGLERPLGFQPQSSHQAIGGDNSPSSYSA